MSEIDALRAEVAALRGALREIECLPGAGECGAQLLANRARTLTPAPALEREGERRVIGTLRGEHEHAGACDHCATCEDHGALWNKAEDALAALSVPGEPGTGETRWLR
jgi:hypothetical protein